MISIGVKSDVHLLANSVDEMIQKQVPFATALALNLVAKQARDALQAAMKLNFDRPTPYTLNSLFISNATKSNLTAIVGLKNGGNSLSAATYLQSEIYGGRNRPLKSTELFPRQYLVPAKDAKLDAYGNIPAALLGAIRQLLQSNQPSMQFGNVIMIVMKEGNPQKLTPGVYQRTAAAKTKTRYSALAGGNVALGGGSGPLKPIVFFESSVQYKVRYDLDGIVEYIVGNNFSSQFVAAMKRSIASSL